MNAYIMGFRQSLGGENIVVGFGHDLDAAESNVRQRSGNDLVNARLSWWDICIEIPNRHNVTVYYR